MNIGGKSEHCKKLAPFNASSLDPGGGSTAGAMGSECLQYGGGAEDCLYANVYAPKHALPRAAGGDEGEGGKLPILFWIHGGGFTAGSGNGFNGTVLASGQDIVVITINYRLGGLGWFASQEPRRRPASTARPEA
jgi:para-nitrobenzyl esterase